MLECRKCKVKIGDPREICPLCQNILDGDQTGLRETFPDIPTVYNQFRLLFKILIFLSIVGGCGSVLANIFLIKGSMWSVIVLASIFYFWSTLNTAVRQKHSISKKILYQVIVLSLLVFAIDRSTKYDGWSLNYVIPSIQSSAMLAVTILAFIQRFRFGEYIIHIVVMALLGIIPLILLLLGWVDIVWPSYLCLFVSAVSTIAVAVFGTREAKDELQKRFHI